MKLMMMIIMKLWIVFSTKGKREDEIRVDDLDGKGKKGDLSFALDELDVPQNNKPLK